MDYELAEELKKAGFKQNQDYPREDAYVEGGNVTTQHGDELTTIAYSPSLSELMEACGDGFDTLYRTNGRWYAIGYTGAKRIDIDGIELDCNSPEEAVARLWLELNK